MPRPGSPRRRWIALALAGAVFASTPFTGCGDDEESGSDLAAESPPASAFPEAKGQTLDELLTTAKPTNDIVALPSGSVFTPGPNRIGFGLFSVDRTQITDGQVALYAAPGAKGVATGPYPAEVESLETDPAFEARTTADDPDAAKVVYLSQVDLDRPGEWRLVAMIRDGEQMVATPMPSIVVSKTERIPAVGDKAPSVHTPTVAEVGDVSQIDTRDPHDTMHDADLADVIGKQPVVLLFATPALCVSRVCGPVVDVAEQVKSEVGGEVAFIHMEVFADNDPNKGVRSQLTAYGLETEPWLFVIDSDGRVVARIEGAFSAGELTDALATAGI
ncbi:MAG: hypothetical protein ABI726_05580 [bacterium]